MKYATDKDLADIVRRQIGYDNTQAELAHKFGISKSYLCDFLQGKRGAGPKILDALGYERTPYYRPSTNTSDRI